MTAATATSPWPAAARSWTVRRDEEVVVQVWRLIANAGPKGISKAKLRDRLNGMDDGPLTQHLQELRRKGHARFDGVNGSSRIGMWVATPTPWPDQPPPAWIALAADSASGHVADELAPEPGAADKAVTAARRVPASIFALGANQTQGLGVDIDAVHMPAEHRQALADAVPQPKAPAPAPVAEGLQPVEATAVVSPLPAQAQFYLTSDNWLVYRTKLGKVVTVPPEDTRVLFGYLDRLATIGQTERLQAVL